MNYYQEISLVPATEISLGFIWQKVFQQVHIALVEHKKFDNTSAIAVGFPEYGRGGFPLGGKLRLFANEQAELEDLDLEKWLNRLSDYTKLQKISSVPDVVTYVNFSRKQVKSPSRIDKDMQQKAKLWAAITNRPIENCLSEMERTKPTKQCKLPYILLHSQQTKHRSPNGHNKFPLFINKTDKNQHIAGTYDCYGLSKTATVPWF